MYTKAQLTLNLQQADVIFITKKFACCYLDLKITEGNY